MRRVLVPAWVVLFIGCDLGTEAPPPPTPVTMEPVGAMGTVPAEPAPVTPIAVGQHTNPQPTQPKAELVAQAEEPEPANDRRPRARRSGRCTNTCQHANDGECDDGRPGAITSLCALGTDCGDCGPANAAARRSAGCTNTCRHANDGECDDGRAGAVTSLCARGTDCGDCGP